jgi:hypothetical protein
MRTVTNKNVKLGFDRESGKLASVFNRATGNECLKGAADLDNVFRVYYDFEMEFEITPVLPG